MPASTRPLYAVLHLTPGASSADVTRSYRRLALQFHPDRDPNGAETFKQIANAYAVLGDAEKRRLYDATGVVAGEGGGGDAAPTTQERSAELEPQLRAFFASYAGSDEEADDVAASYAACDGDFARMVRERLVFDNGKAGEVQRLYALTRRLIDTTHRLRATAAWTRSTTAGALRKLERSMAKERAQAEEALREMGLDAHGEAAQRGDSHRRDNDDGNGSSSGGSMLALQSMMQQRQRSTWANMIADLEEKYVTKTKPRPTSRPPSSTSRKRTARDAAPAAAAPTARQAGQKATKQSKRQRRKQE